MNKDPHAKFNSWFKEAKNSLNEPEAMTLSTISKNGFPSSRLVLLKSADENGFTFFTNLKSQKSQEIIQTPKVALNFFWQSLGKQIRIQGIASQVDDELADHYFATRPRLSKIGAWASKQSQELTTPLELEKRIAKFSLKFKLNDIPRPDFWSGFLVKANRFEFWQNKSFRLHERLVFELIDNSWQNKRLFP